MKSTGDAQRALLESGVPVEEIDLYRIILADGTALYWADASQDVSYGGHTYLAPPGAPIVASRGAVKTSTDLAIESLELTFSDPDYRLGGRTLTNTAAVGLWDGAQVTVFRAYTSGAVSTANGCLVVFDGLVSPPEPASTELKVTIESALAYLAKKKIPFRAYSPSCPYDVYGPACGLARSSFAAARTVLAGSTASVLQTQDIGASAGSYDLGTVIFSSGALAGQGRPIASYVGGVITLMVPFRVAPAPGDAFSAAFGCDQQLLTCKNRFGNLNRFGAMPWIPQPESVR